MFTTQHNGSGSATDPGADGGGLPLHDGAAYLGRNGLEVARLGQAVARRCFPRLGEDGRLYVYRNGVYAPDEHAVAIAVRELLGNAYRQNRVHEVLSWLKAHDPSLPAQPDRQYLNVANGLIDWKTGQLHPHTPGYPSTIQLPVVWDPEARCPNVLEFLEQVLASDALDFVLEIIGYALYAGNPLHKALLLLGPGRNGKSILEALIRALLGAHNTSAVTLHALGENRFAPAELQGKLANICGDIAPRTVERTDVFKQLTGSDPIYAERKHGQLFMFTSIALPIFSANQMPGTGDQSEGWFARWLVVKMDRQFIGPDADPDLPEKLTTQQELSGLLNLAVDGLRPLMARGHFALPPSARAASEAYRQHADTVRAFVVDRCHLDGRSLTKKTALHQAYVDWCAQEGRTPEKRGAFYGRILDGWPGKITKKHQNDGDYFTGIHLLGE